MTASHWQVLFVYFCFTLIATLLALAKRWVKPKSNSGSVWRKYPTYILINLLFLTASWLPTRWRVLTILLAIMGALASWEIVRGLFQSAKTSILNMFLPCATFALIVVADFVDITIWLNIWLTMLMVLITVSTVIGNPVDYGPRALALAGCIIYLPACLAAYIWIQHSNPSGFHAAFLYLVVATNDALAQITGEFLGKRPLVPHISPSKTMEGALGGILFAGAMGLSLSNIMEWSNVTGVVMGLTAGITGLLGDLTASAWKRALGLKNFSALLGAQGGVLDRFDGLIFAAPVIYLLLVIAF